MILGDKMSGVRGSGGAAETFEGAESEKRNPYSLVSATGSSSLSGLMSPHDCLGSRGISGSFESPKTRDAQNRYGFLFSVQLFPFIRKPPLAAVHAVLWGYWGESEKRNPYLLASRLSTAPRTLPRDEPNSA